MIPSAPLFPAAQEPAVPDDGTHVLHLWRPKATPCMDAQTSIPGLYALPCAPWPNCVIGSSPPSQQLTRRVVAGRHVPDGRRMGICRVAGRLLLALGARN